MLICSDRSSICDEFKVLSFPDPLSTRSPPWLCHIAKRYSYSLSLSVIPSHASSMTRPAFTSPCAMSFFFRLHSSLISQSSNHSTISKPTNPTQPKLTNQPAIEVCHKSVKERKETERRGTSRQVSPTSIINVMRSQQLLFICSVGIIHS